MTTKIALQAQYGTDTNLRTRIAIHDKYSTNKQGFGNWIFERYRIQEGNNVLELGCGDGSMWQNRTLPTGTTLFLTDFSTGMLASAQAKLAVQTQIHFAQVDIQAIPHPDDSFEVVIANMMLYHVPDLPKALAEVRRVLKPGGFFYCATYGENGITEYVQDLLAMHGYPAQRTKGTFTLQNGGDILKPYFSTVEKHLYKDSLAVTDTADLVEYVASLRGIVDYTDLTPDVLYGILDAQKKDGVIDVPKDYGMFVAVK